MQNESSYKINRKSSQIKTHFILSLFIKLLEELTRISMLLSIVFMNLNQVLCAQRKNRNRLLEIILVYTFEKMKKTRVKLIHFSC